MFNTVQYFIVLLDHCPLSLIPSVSTQFLLGPLQGVLGIQLEAGLETEFVGNLKLLSVAIVNLRSGRDPLGPDLELLVKSVKGVIGACPP